MVDEYFNDGYEKGQKDLAETVLERIKAKNESPEIKLAWVEGYMQGLADNLPKETG